MNDKNIDEVKKKKPTLVQGVKNVIQCNIN